MEFLSNQPGGSLVEDAVLFGTSILITFSPLFGVLGTQMFEHIPVSFQLFEWPFAFPLERSSYQGLCGLGARAGEEKSIPDSTHCCPMLSGNQELEPSLALRCVLWILCAGG